MTNTKNKRTWERNKRNKQILLDIKNEEKNMAIDFLSKSCRIQKIGLFFIPRTNISVFLSLFLIEYLS